MIRILFVCHGNICRSPMAEFVMKDLVRKAGGEDHFHIASAATNPDEVGSPVHPGTRNRLAKEGISVAGKISRQMTRSDYDAYDYLIGMDRWNIRNMTNIVGGDREGKIHLLLEYAGRPGEDIADPWYTGNFEETYRDVLDGCSGLLEQLWKSR